MGTDCAVEVATPRRRLGRVEMVIAPQDPAGSNWVIRASDEGHLESRGSAAAYKIRAKGAIDWRSRWL